jgi:long-chain acyl-CoA synthetase
MPEVTPSSRAIATTVARLSGSVAERYGEQLAARHKVGGEWREQTYAETGAAIDELALGLIDLGIEPGDRICLLSDTRVDWTVASYAISAAGAIVVPIYPTSSPRECEWVAGNSRARAVVCENEAQRAKIDEVRGALPQLEHVLGIESAAGCVTLEELRARGRRRGADELSARRAVVDPQDAYTIIYTSGTTGPPKGVVLTHANAMSVCEMVEEIKFVQPADVTYLFLPQAHAYALTVQLASFDQGTTIAYYGGDSTQILAEVIETQPTYLPSVPRIFEKLYGAAMKLQENAGAEDRERFRRAVALGVEVRRRRVHGESVSGEMEQAFAAADGQIFARVRALFGGHIRLAVTGAAPIAPEILEFFYAAGVPVLEGWGMTETVAVGTVGTLEQFKFGTVGRPLPGIEIRIAPADGEILMRGRNVFREYWDNPQATAETLVDGWLHTGDVGELDDEGYLKITGRKKDIIITAGGKNLTPSNIENELKQSRFISHAFMYADRRPYPVALVTLDPEEIVPWAQDQGLPQEIAELAQHEVVRELVQQELDRANANYAPVEQIKKFAILDHDLSIETGELTPTLKVKRSVINDRYADLFAELYG